MSGRRQGSFEALLAHQEIQSVRILSETQFFLWHFGKTYPVESSYEIEFGNMKPSSDYRPSCQF